METEQNDSLELSRRRFSVFIAVFLVLFSISFLAGYLGSKYGGAVDTGLRNIGQKTVQVNEESATVDVAKKVEASVVSITGEQATLDFFGRVRKSQSSGTGFVVSEDGLIITNKHVVSGAGSYSVFTSDGKEYKAEVKATDPYFDIAFLKVNAKGLKPIVFGDSDSLQVGQKVVAIGNALGQFQNTVTTGVVSAIGRAIEAGDNSGSTEVLENLIQTDAAINPGNSGGPLLNIEGQVIAINTAVASDAEGIGFAIPVNVARSALTSVVKNGKISRPMMGIRYINITKEYAARNNLTVQSGALIYAENAQPVLPGSPAARAGLKQNDIITKINNDKIGEGRSLIGLVSKYQPGDKVKVTYLRDGKESSVEVTLIASES